MYQHVRQLQWVHKIIYHIDLFIITEADTLAGHVKGSVHLNKRNTYLPSLTADVFL